VSAVVLFQLALWITIFGATAFWILWENGNRRRWTQYRARNWQNTPGRFNEGGVVPQVGGRSRVGYQVRLGYDYQAGVKQTGVCTLPFHGVYSSEKEAEECRQLVANRNIPVRVSPHDPKRSAILDDDLKSLLPR
jgi:hypothetical protein